MSLDVRMGEPIDPVNVTRRFDMSGRDEAILISRIDELRRAIRMREGSILDIRWTRDKKNGAHRASILYELPIERNLAR
jgi:hypothetical protein